MFLRSLERLSVSLSCAQRLLLRFEAAQCPLLHTPHSHFNADLQMLHLHSFLKGQGCCLNGKFRWHRVILDQTGLPSLLPSCSRGLFCILLPTLLYLTSPCRSCIQHPRNQSIPRKHSSGDTSLTILDPEQNVSEHAMRSAGNSDLLT